MSSFPVVPQQEPNSLRRCPVRLVRIFLLRGPCVLRGAADGRLRWLPRIAATTNGLRTIVSYRMQRLKEAQEVVVQRAPLVGAGSTYPMRIGHGEPVCLPIRATEIGFRDQGPD